MKRPILITALAALLTTGANAATITKLTLDYDYGGNISGACETGGADCWITTDCGTSNDCELAPGETIQRRCEFSAHDSYVTPLEGGIVGIHCYERSEIVPGFWGSWIFDEDYSAYINWDSVNEEWDFTEGDEFVRTDLEDYLPMEGYNTSYWDGVNIDDDGNDVELLHPPGCDPDDIEVETCAPPGPFFQFVTQVGILDWKPKGQMPNSCDVSCASLADYACQTFVPKVS